MREIPDFSKFWATGYDDAFYGKGLLPFCMRQSHKLLEKRFSENDYFENIVEIGSGVGYHLDFVRCKFSNYTMLDSNTFVIQKLKSKYSNNAKISIKEIMGGGAFFRQFF